METGALCSQTGAEPLYSRAGSCVPTQQRDGGWSSMLPAGAEPLYPRVGRCALILAEGWRLELHAPSRGRVQEPLPAPHTTRGPHSSCNSCALLLTLPSTHTEVHWAATQVQAAGFLSETSASFR